MNVGIIGCRGIPNGYGGFEQFAQYLSEGLVELGHSVSVYSPHTHSYQLDHWNGVRIIHVQDPEEKVGTIGQFIYDYNSIMDSHKRGFDIILQLGYTSSSVWHKLLPKNVPIITNMDGLEWKRTKYNKIVKVFLKHAEKLAAIHSDFLIADSIGIQNHLMKTYNKESTYIPYGANLFNDPSITLVENLDLKLFTYDMVVARLEPENNVETILEGFTESSVERNIIVVGDYFTRYGLYLREKFTDERIKFLGKIYDINILNNLRFFSHLYFHGHSVGGTNPSLLEAMASNALICAHDNIFNKSILREDAFYFKNSEEVTHVLTTTRNKNDYGYKIDNNRDKIATQYNWPKIIESYETFMRKVINNSNDDDVNSSGLILSDEFARAGYESELAL